jgi:broad specificity phosphatase PhoE
MAATHLYITRHGQTEWNLEQRIQGHQDSPLTGLGVTQANALGEALAGVKLDAIYSSSSQRARRTAEIIRGHGARAVEIRIDDRLREIHMGNWEGLRRDQVEAASPKAHRVYWERPDVYEPTNGGESVRDVAARVVPLLKRMLTVHNGESILIVTHTVPLKVIMSYFEDRPLARLWDPPFIHPASLSYITVDGNGFAIGKYGDMSHFPDPDNR